MAGGGLSEIPDAELRDAERPVPLGSIHEQVPLVAFGPVVTRAWQLFKRRFWAYTGLYALPWVGLVLLGIFAVVVVASSPDRAPSGMKDVDADPFTDPLFIVFALIALAGQLILYLSQAGIAWLGLAELEGRRCSFAEALAVAAVRSVQTVFVVIVMWAAIAVAASVPSVAMWYALDSLSLDPEAIWLLIFGAGVVSMAVAAYLHAGLWLAVPIVVNEHRLLGALGRSWSLTKGRRFRVLGIMFFVFTASALAFVLPFGVFLQLPAVAFSSVVSAVTYAALVREREGVDGESLVRTFE